MRLMRVGGALSWQARDVLISAFARYKQVPGFLEQMRQQVQATARDDQQRTYMDLVLSSMVSTTTADGLASLQPQDIQAAAVHFGFHDTRHEGLLDEAQAANAAGAISGIGTIMALVGTKATKRAQRVDLMRRLDVDKNGVVDFNEMCLFMCQVNQQRERAVIKLQCQERGKQARRRVEARRCSVTLLRRFCRLKQEMANWAEAFFQVKGHPPAVADKFASKTFGDLLLTAYDALRQWREVNPGMSHRQALHHLSQKAAKSAAVKHPPFDGRAALADGEEDSRAEERLGVQLGLLQHALASRKPAQFFPEMRLRMRGRQSVTQELQQEKAQYYNTVMSAIRSNGLVDGFSGLTPADLSRTAVLFGEMDSDHDGRVDVGDMIDLMARLGNQLEKNYSINEAHSLFVEVDANQDLFVDFNELLHFHRCVALRQHETYTAKKDRIPGAQLAVLWDFHMEPQDARADLEAVLEGPRAAVQSALCLRKLPEFWPEMTQMVHSNLELLETQEYFDTVLNACQSQAVIDGCDSMTEMEMRHAAAVFGEHDTDHDGLLDRGDFELLMSSLLLKSGKQYTEDQRQQLLDQLFQNADLNHNQQLDFNEFCYMRRRGWQYPNDDEAKSINRATRLRVQDKALVVAAGSVASEVASDLANARVAVARARSTITDFESTTLQAVARAGEAASALTQLSAEISKATQGFRRFEAIAKNALLETSGYEFEQLKKMDGRMNGYDDPTT